MSVLDQLRAAIQQGAIPLTPPPEAPSGWEAPAPVQRPRRGPAKKDQITQGRGGLSIDDLDEAPAGAPPTLRTQLVQSLEAQEAAIQGIALGLEPELPLEADPRVVQPGTPVVAVAEPAAPPTPADSAASAASAAPIDFELPLDLSALPLFANVDGPAGSGKTFWAKELARQNPGVILAATTGIAAVNLGEGTTINALLRYFDTRDLSDKFTGGMIESTLKKRRRLGLTRIVLDEKSMLNAEQLTILCHAIDNTNQDREADAPELGLILLGDFAQLAPVPDRDPADSSGRKKLPVEYAFESGEWERFAAHPLRLTRIRRQGDQEFVAALQGIRRGDPRSIAFFREFLHQSADMAYPGPTIMAKNDQVERFNQLRLSGLHTPQHGFPSKRWGDQQPEWQKHVPDTLQLKEGSRVMVLANRNIAGPEELPDYLYTNGDLGTFEGKEDLLELEGVRRTSLPRGLLIAQVSVARVKLDRTQSVVKVVYITRQRAIPLEVGRRKALRAEGHEDRITDDGKYEVTGEVTYLPLRLAYATTVHKSQGLSLDAVQLNIRDHFFGSPGMLYVALSRARTAPGLRIIGNADTLRARMQTNVKVVPWL